MNPRRQVTSLFKNSAEEDSAYGDFIMDGKARTESTFPADTAKHVRERGCLVIIFQQQTPLRRRHVGPR